MSAFMTLDDLEPFLQKSAVFSLILLQYSDKIDSVTQSGPSRSSSIFATFERRCEDSTSAPTIPASQQQQYFTTAANNTTPVLQLLINSGQPATRAPQSQLTTHITNITGPELSGHLGSLDNSHDSASANQGPSYAADIQRNTEFDPQQQNSASELIPPQICEPLLDNSVVILPHQQQPLSIACHLPHPSPSTTATSRLVYPTNYRLPTFDTVDKQRPSIIPSGQSSLSVTQTAEHQSSNLQHLPPSSVPPPA